MFANVRAAIAQLGERQTEDLKVPGSIPGLGIYCAQEPLAPAARRGEQAMFAAFFNFPALPDSADNRDPHRACKERSPATSA